MSRVFTCIFEAAAPLTAAITNHQQELVTQQEEQGQSMVLRSSWSMILILPPVQYFGMCTSTESHGNGYYPSPPAHEDIWGSRR